MYLEQRMLQLKHYYACVCASGRNTYQLPCAMGRQCVPLNLNLYKFYGTFFFLILFCAATQLMSWLFILDLYPGTY